MDAETSGSGMNAIIDAEMSRMNKTLDAEMSRMNETLDGETNRILDAKMNETNAIHPEMSGSGLIETPDPGINADMKSTNANIDVESETCESKSNTSNTLSLVHDH